MSDSPSTPPQPTWQPPATGLVWNNGLWRAKGESTISYPEHANEFCFAVEESSYWFRHRCNCIQAILTALPPAGVFYDIGGGNGQLVRAMQDAGLEAVLIEPGPGAQNARRRGVRQIIQATLNDAGFSPGSLPAVGAFDVAEHIGDDLAFFTTLRRVLQPGGRLYCSVPAGPAWWSHDDEFAGHYRRYRMESLAEVVQKSGFVIEFLSPFFTWLVLPVAMVRALPWRLGIGRRAKVGTKRAIDADHQLPALLAGPVGAIHNWELRRLMRKHPLPMGTSILCVAKSA